MKFYPVYIFVFFFAFACKEDAAKDISEVDFLLCDAEKVIDQGDRLVFASSEESMQLSVGEVQSDEFSHSGKYSAKLDSIQKFAFGITFSNFKAGEYLRFSTWQKKGNSRAFLSVVIIGDDFRSTVNTSYSNLTEVDGDWVQHNISIIVSEGVKKIEVSVTGGGGEAYFDDFEFQKSASIPKGDGLSNLNIVLPEMSKTTLKGFVNEARKGKIIKDEHKSYVKGKLMTSAGTSKIKVKLKGDWVDHLSSGKVSCRIKMKGNNAYDGLKTFSLHHAKTRNYLDEWLVHKIADREDVLSTRYDFVNVQVNATDFGVYALEEHFDKQLLEQRERREGPILKFDETGVWELGFNESEKVKLIDFPYFEGAVTDVFKKNRTLSSVSLKKNFMDGISLMELFKNGEMQVSDVFDMDQLAKYYVIIDLCGGHHAAAWHNRRFYFNPITQKLEHILYDVMPFMYGDYYSNSMALKLPDGKRGKDVGLDNAIILNRNFKERYMFYLNAMSKKSYLDSLFTDLDSELDLLTKAIQIEEPYYHFSKIRYYENAEHMRSHFDELNNLWEQTLSANNGPDHWVVDKTYKPRVDSVFFEKVSVNAYLKKIDSVTYSVQFENYHLNDITLCGYEAKGWPRHAIQLNEEVVLKGFKKKSDIVHLKFEREPKKIFFKVSNRLDRYYQVNLMPWTEPGSHSSRMMIKSKPIAVKPYRIVGDKAIFSGRILIDELIYVPEHLEVEMKADCNISFVGKGGLIVSNKFTAKGTKSRPIQIYSWSKDCQGLTILNAGSAVFENVHFRGLSNLNYKNWELTGAITIYETDVIMNNVTIDSSLAEDALNIVRSNFEINNLNIKNTVSDGFDADFCTGTITNSYVGHTGNDCIDFSGSTISLENIVIEESGDKGISGGENSKLKLTQISIVGAVTGIAAKDKTVIEGDNISISNTSYGLMAFQKKAEYGPASLNLSHTSFEKTESIQLLDKGSVIILNGVKTKGEIKIDVEQLYYRFE